MLSKNRKGEMGMGTLIIFIAMILVAAIAAGVLISTTGTLQNKALATGKAATQEVGTSMQGLEVYAEDGSGQTVNYFYQTIKLAAGSEPIRFGDTLLTAGLKNQSADFNFDSAGNCSDTSSLTSGVFGIEYLIQGNSFNDGYLNKGDVVKICFAMPRAVNEDEPVKTTLTPVVGTPLQLDMRTPDLMVNKRIPLYP